MAKKVNAACALEEHGAAHQALNELYRALRDLNPAAAGLQEREALARSGCREVIP